MRASGPWEAGEGNERHRDAQRGGGSVHMTLSVAHADIPIAVVTLATTSHGAAQAGRRAQAGRPRICSPPPAGFAADVGFLCCLSCRQGPSETAYYQPGHVPTCSSGAGTGDGHCHGPAGRTVGLMGHGIWGQVRWGRRGGGLCWWCPQLWGREGGGVLGRG